MVNAMAHFLIQRPVNGMVEIVQISMPIIPIAKRIIPRTLPFVQREACGLDDGWTEPFRPLCGFKADGCSRSFESKLSFYLL